MIITKAKYRNTTVGADIVNKDIVTTIDGIEMFVPINAGNRHYEAILEWVADGNTIEEAD